MNIDYPNWNGFAAGLSGLELPPESGEESRPRGRAVEAGTKTGSWRYPAGAKRGRMVGLAFVVSVALHGAFFIGLNGRKVPKAVLPDTTTVEVNFAVPPKVDEELLDEEVVDMTGERGEALAGVDVPSLPDVLTTVDLTGFTQAFDMSSLLPRANVEGAKNLSVIPGNFRRGGAGGTATSIGNIFNLSDLDRAPTPTFQPAPAVPHNLIREAAGAHVTVEFIVSVKGEVLEPRVVSSDNTAFDELAVRAIRKWKFRPGFRRGKTVNVRMQQPMRFKIGE